MDTATFRDLLTPLEQLPRDVTDVVVISSESHRRISELVQALFPAARVHYFSQTTSTNDRMAELMRSPRPQLILDCGDYSQRATVRHFTSLFYFLADGGTYIVDQLPRATHSDDVYAHNIVDLLADLAVIRALPRKADRTPWPASRHELAAAVADIVVNGRVAVVRKRLHHLVKLREEEANDILTARYGLTWSRIELIRPARTVLSRTRIISHGDGPLDPLRTSFDVPDLHLRHYPDVLCAAMQVAAYGDYLLPDSFRHPHARVLGNRHTHYVTPLFSRLKMHCHPDKPRRLAGMYYFLDTEHPGHFGHITTEVLGRYWGWERARQADPSVRLLISSRDPRNVPGFQRTILAALGISSDRIEVIHPHDPVHVECLVSGTPQFENPYYVDPEITDTWERLAFGLGLDSRRSTSRKARKIFVSRKPESKRWCYETRKIERFFRQKGFHVLYPEDQPYQEQAHTFANAHVIAGFGGSGMFNMLLNPRAKVLILNGNGYNAENEHLIAAANGNELHYFWGRSDLQVTDGHTQLEAARSNFSFDLRQYRKELVQTIKSF